MRVGYILWWSLYKECLLLNIVMYVSCWFVSVLSCFGECVMWFSMCIVVVFFIEILSFLIFLCWRLWVKIFVLRWLILVLWKLFFKRVVNVVCLCGLGRWLVCWSIWVLSRLWVLVMILICGVMCICLVLCFMSFLLVSFCCYWRRFIR